jgi:hypothetical protein
MQGFKSMTPAQRGLAYLAGWSVFTLIGGICVFGLVYFALAPRTTAGSQQPRRTPTTPVQLGVPTLVPTAIIAPTLVQATQPPAATDAPAAPAVGQFTVVTLTSPVARGAEATLKIQTQPGAACKVIFYGSDAARLNKGGLPDIIADASGICAWTWTVSGKAVPGTGKLVVKAGDQTQTLDIIIQ